MLQYIQDVPPLNMEDYLFKGNPTLLNQLLVFRVIPDEVFHGSKYITMCV